MVRRTVCEMLPRSQRVKRTRQGSNDIGDPYSCAALVMGMTSRFQGRSLLFSNRQFFFSVPFTKPALLFTVNDSREDGNQLQQKLHVLRTKHRLCVGSCPHFCGGTEMHSRRAFVEFVLAAVFVCFQGVLFFSPTFPNTRGWFRTNPLCLVSYHPLRGKQHCFCVLLLGWRAL
mmetsp:Transcript_38971/g.103569  ORF Transcript_38971/g.103569 Transcript_38971/m.103569 type:complete len:173 (-) Transcript_38971:908-1426(-)